MLRLFRRARRPIISPVAGIETGGQQRSSTAGNATTPTVGRDLRPVVASEGKERGGRSCA